MHALDALTHLGVCKGELLSRKKKQTDKLSTFYIYIYEFVCLFERVVQPIPSAIGPEL